MMRAINSAAFITTFTMLITAAWVVSLPMRVLIPSLATSFTTVDAAMLLILGYWFSTQAIRNRGGSR